METQTKNINGTHISPYQDYKNPVFIDYKSHGTVLKISDIAVAKIPHSTFYVGREMKLAKLLHESGISVPKPLGWDYILCSTERKHPVKAFIMEFVRGEIGNVLKKSINPRDNQRYDLAQKLLEIELKKAEQFGFELGCDCRSGENYILTPDDRIVLLDFSLWAHPKAPNIQRKFCDGEFVIENLIDPDDFEWRKKVYGKYI